MPLSTFNSESELRRSRLVKRTTVFVLLTIAVMLAGCEVFARRVVERKSKVQRVVNQEYAEAIHIRRAAGVGSRQLLVVGNSLAGLDIDLDELKNRLPRDWEAHRFWIYNTSYEDWYFGIRRLLADGSQPDVVAIVLAAMHWYDPGTRGDYAAQYLFQTRDFPLIQAQLKLDNTATVSLLLSRYSKFYALRSDIRKVLLNALLPDLPRMYSLFKPGPARRISDRELITLAAARMASLSRLVRGYGASLVVVVPPIPSAREEHQEALRVAAARTGVAAVIPMTCADVPGGDFADDVHLTPRGAKLFTAKMAEDLASVISK